jgi:hypothetical protein
MNSGRYDRQAAHAILAPRVFALVVLVFPGMVRPCHAQFEPEVFTAGRSLHQALSANPPDPGEAVSILIGYDGPVNRTVLQSKWLYFLSEQAPGTTEEKRKKLAELLDAFDESFADGDAARQGARRFIRLRDELLGRTTPQTEIERSALFFVDRLRRLPAAHRGLLQEFGRLAKRRTQPGG